MNTTTAYLAHEGFLPQLQRELKGIREIHGRLVVCDGPPQAALWVDNVWYDVQRIAVESIGKAAGALREQQRNWALYSSAHHRRAALIQGKLPHVGARPLAFGDPAPSAPLGSWTMSQHGELLAATRCSSPFANGQVQFIEDKQTPPNRAYLKLWEILTLLPKRPGPGDLCLDLGSSPGGWTWVLQGLGARVLSVDKAPLERGIDKLPGVDFRQQSAFALEPGASSPVDWLFCDIACYPARLLTMIQRWLEADACRNFVCTVKLQGDLKEEDLAGFRELRGSELRHLWHNKHELTWTLLRE